ncbi:hypothetical protein [Amycolatopsis keratiniphila]|uniref:hypothetical protein n=1 Tax=Amycolatopsis keratiniphila TaxID=129921 RepID=UPI00087D86CF|nr:hypothetical protein [Amycolatopsis keratiniphila]OLZ56890.1 hypothetical protein BS330_15940 [Amycolatopsis keratiniphila subsp. nogabecina]SDU48292.1 hypothetical protein SAMN04489733_4850 [Amycolatopsis keratiniphila]
MPPKRLSAVLCGLFLAAACATPESAVTSSPTTAGDEALTASEALGEYSSLDYCSLVDQRKVIGGGNAVKPPLTSFEFCRLEFVEGANRYTVTTGPITSGQDPNNQPYEYAGPLPEGLSVQQSTFNQDTTCTRLLTFADGIRLSIAVTSDDKAPADQADRCRTADATVGSAAGVITERKVGRLNLDQRSWGRVAPCALLDQHELDAAAGAETKPAPALSGHNCIRGKVSFSLSVGADTTPGATEALGGRQVQVATSGAFCQVTTHRPIPGTPDRVEQAALSVVGVDGAAEDATCAAAREVAAAVFPKLP